MLEEFFWNYFENTGNIDAYMATKDFESDEREEQGYNYPFGDYNKQDDYLNGEMN